MKDRVPTIIAPLGAGSGVTQDGRLVAGVTRKGRAISLSDGRVAQPRRAAAIPVFASQMGRGTRAWDEEQAVPLIATTPPSEAAVYLRWDRPSEAEMARGIKYDLNLWAYLVTGDPINGETLLTAYNDTSKSFPNNDTPMLDLNLHDDRDGWTPITDDADVSFSYNERMFITFSNFTAGITRAYIGAMVWNWFVDDPEAVLHLDDVPGSSIVIRAGEEIFLSFGTLAGYTPAFPTPSTRTAILGYFQQESVGVYVWVNEQIYLGDNIDSPQLTWPPSTWPPS